MTNNKQESESVIDLVGKNNFDEIKKMDRIKADVTKEEPKQYSAEKSSLEKSHINDNSSAETLPSRCQTVISRVEEITCMVVLTPLALSAFGCLVLCMYLEGRNLDGI